MKLCTEQQVCRLAQLDMFNLTIIDITCNPSMVLKEGAVMDVDGETDIERLIAADQKRFQASLKKLKRRFERQLRASEHIEAKDDTTINRSIESYRKLIGNEFRELAETLGESEEGAALQKRALALSILWLGGKTK